jgi:hypothetical protein
MIKNRKKAMFYFLRFFLWILFFRAFIFCGVAVSALDFNRESRAGDAYIVSISAESSTVCVIKGKSGEKKIEKGKSINIEADLSVTTTDEKGSPSAFSLIIKKISGKNDSKTNLFADGYEEFRIEWRNGQLFVFLNEKTKSPSPEELELLRLVFHQPSSSKISDIFGPKREIKPGDNWNPPSDFIKNIFAAKGVKISNDNIVNTAVCEGIDANESGRIFILRSELLIKDIPDFEFQYETKIIMPENKRYPPLSIKSKSTERIIRREFKGEGSLAEDIEEMDISISQSLSSDLTPLKILNQADE